MKIIIGETYNGLTIIGESSRSTKSGGRCWICKCNHCGNIVEFSTRSIHNKNGCGFCNISQPVKKIRDILINNNVTFIMEKVFSDLYINTSYFRFDFFVNNQYIVEYDDKGHFRDTDVGRKRREYDFIKNKYCFDHNIPIIRIPYVLNDIYNYQDINIDTSDFLLTPSTELQYYEHYKI